MSKKMIWGFGVLMLLICTTFVYMTVRNLVEIRQLKQKADAIQKPTEDRNKQKPVVKADEQPPAEQGFKWVWHNDHWDKVPIDAPVEVSDKTQQQADATPHGLGKYVSDTPIPESMPMPDIPLPDDLKNMDWKRWNQKYQAEWKRYIHALDLAVERIDKEVKSLRANMPLKNSPDYPAALAKLDTKVLEQNRLLVERGKRIHQADAASEAAFEKYILVRFGKKRYE